MLHPFSTTRHSFMTSFFSRFSMFSTLLFVMICSSLNRFWKGSSAFRSTYEVPLM